MNKPFDEIDAREILAFCDVDNFLMIDDRGVWPSVEHDVLLAAEADQLRWSPARVVGSGSDSSNRLDVPALPFPFSGRDLAAFMIGGIGRMVADSYGVFSDEIDQTALSSLDPNTKAERAIVEAFTALQEAGFLMDPDTDEATETDEMVRYLLTPVKGVTNKERTTTTATHQINPTSRENRILELLVDEGYNPLELPFRKPGMRGVKLEIKALALLDKSLFTSGSFDGAWQRLRDDGRLFGSI